VVRRAELSVSLVKLSQLVGTKRLDPEYYQPHYQELHNKLKAIGAVTVESFADANDGFHESPVWVEEGGIPCISAKCVKDNYFVLTNMGQVSLTQRDENPTKEARIGDVLLTSVGTIGNSAVVHKEILPAIMDRHVGIIRVRKDARVDPYYLAAFFNSEYGRFQTLRESTGNVQLNLFIEKMNKLLVPIGSEFNAVGKKVRTAYDKFRESKQLYADVEGLLASELGLDKLDLSESLSSVKNLSDVYRSKRIDAEYFQPKYERTLKLMGKSGNTLSDIANLSKSRFEPESGKAFNYIEISDLTHDGLAESQIIQGEEAPSRAQWIVRKGDVITSTVRPIRRLSAMIEAEQEGFVCSSGFVVLQPKSIPPELLLTYLRIPVVCEILDLYTTASMYPAISTADLLNIPVTLPTDKKIVNEIVGKIQQSRQARQESKRLLAEAKSEVEKLIEK